MRYCFCLIFIFIFCFAFGQKLAYKNELRFTTDNDAYLLQKKDGYYTNGLFLKLSSAKEKHGNKIINSYELGQMIFTPQDVFFYREGGIDRPFCGYLYFTCSKAIFLPKQQVLQWAVSLGTVGPNSLGQNVQETIHQWFQYKTFKSWDTQIANEIGVNTTVKYAISYTPFKTELIKLVPEAEATIGNTFTNAKIGGYVCFGLMENISNSSLFSASINNKNVEKKYNAELFIYWHPQLMAQVYNATVQGGLFSNDDKDVTALIWPTIYSQSFGLLLVMGRLTTKLEVTYLTQEARTQKAPQRYASIGVGYKFN